MSLSGSMKYMIVSFTFALSACQHGLSQPSGADETVGKTVEMAILEQSILCPGAKSGLTEVTSSKQWSKILAASPFSDPVVLPKAWLEQYRLFVVSDGRKPNGGYGIDVEKQALFNSADSGEDQLNITAVVHSPAKGSITTQVITSPCVLVGAPKGDYQVRLITN